LYKPIVSLRQGEGRTSVPGAVRPSYTAAGAQFEARGLPRRPLQDLYHFLMGANWGSLLALCLVGYVGVNAVFACLYWLYPGCIVNARPGYFSDAFWFSVQTFATIGFGVMSPANSYAHVLVTFESFLGLFCLAVGTGIVFSKFSRPTARLGFSSHAIVTRYNNKPCLSFRVAHQRRGGLIDVSAKVSVLIDETTAEGVLMRRAHDLTLERAHMPMLALAWTVMHVLDESSPLCGLSEENIDARLVAVFVVVSGIDDTTLDGLIARHSYNRGSIVFGVKFVDMIERQGTGHLVVHHDKLSNVEPLG